MSLFLLNILLALAWAALTGRFEPVNLLFGFLLAFALLWLAFRRRNEGRYFKQVPRVFELLAFFLMDVVRANLRLARTVLSPRMNLRPAVVAVPLDLKSEAGLVLLINLVTLTPGTLGLDVSTDRRIMYIHTVWLDAPEQFVRGIKQGYERRLMRILEA